MFSSRRFFALSIARAVGGLGILAVGAAGVALAFTPVPTTPNDFFIAGTQPNTLVDPLISAQVCSFCHADYDEAAAPWNRWSASMMGQSARDPIFKAALAIAEQDAVASGETCIRCHAPQGWLNGRSTPSNGSALTVEDHQGVSCSVCHRMVDPDYTPGVDPIDDMLIVANINPPALLDPHNGSFVIDPKDKRRGPFNLDADWANQPTMGWPGYHEFRQSPFHLSSSMCASCHDVSLEHFSRQPDGRYLLNANNTPGPDKFQQFPEQRTYSEWAQSLFAQGPVNLGGRFGGTSGPLVSTCQDCHMPTIEGQGCALDPPTRPQLPQHNFNGANSWVLRAVRSLFPDSETGLTEDAVIASTARNLAMMAAASDLAVSRVGPNLNVRITNFTGHKLPTGYSEGRRMWINVQFKNAADQIIQERGGYDYSTATLDGASTKVYERTSSIAPETAAITGQPAGESFHLVLNSVIAKDNRIPPMGFNNAQFEMVQAGSMPTGLYADGQYWDDTQFIIPANAVTASVTIYHQTSSREYMEFLRDANTTNSAGMVAYNAWVAFDKSEPVLMDVATIGLTCPCDWNNSGALSVQDIFDFLTSYFTGNADFNQSGATTVQDIFDFLMCYFNGCP